MSIRPMIKDEDTHTHTYNEIHRKDKNFAIYLMDGLEGIVKPDRERQRLYDITFYMEFKKPVN